MRRLAPPPAAEAPALPVARPAAARAAPGGPRRAFVLTTAPGTADPPRLAGPWAVAGWAPLAASGDGALAARLAEARAEVVVVCLAPDAPPALRDRILALAAGPRPLRIVPWAPPLRGGPGPVVRYALPLGRRARALKRALDLAVGAPALLAALPLLLAVGLLIRLDSPGPALFRQHRIGEDGRLFEMYKFRTMHHQPEQAEAALRAAAPDAPLPPGHDYKLPDDPRITRAGRFLRRASLDELPQLLNVLRGDMSLVGPRPELPGIVARYATWQLARLAAPPGMTGWWQVNGRSNHPMHLSTDEDLYYLANQSLAFDLRILARTLLAVLRGTGAY